MNGTQNPAGTAGNFTVTYKTNADVEMGTLTYETVSYTHLDVYKRQAP